MTEVGVVVESKLGVHAEYLSHASNLCLNLGKRVDLNLRSILLLEQLVELDEGLRRLLLVLRLEAELDGGGEGLLVQESEVVIDRDGENRRRVVTRNILNARGSVSSSFRCGEGRTSFLLDGTRPARVR